jgi:hypothetical protein
MRFSSRAAFHLWVGVCSVVIAACSAGGASQSASKKLVAIPVASSLRPTPNGFSFANFPASASTEQFQEDDLVAMFGAEVCVDGNVNPCRLIAEAAAWARMVNQVRASGVCEGFVVEASRRFNAGSQPPTVELANDPTTTHQIFQAFATQFIPAVQQERDTWANASITSVVAELASSLQDGTVNYTMGLYTERGGHAVLPYAIEFPSADQAIIHIYDSNWPGKNRFVDVDLTNDTWSFSFSAPDPLQDTNPWTGGTGDMDLASLDARASTACPFCVGAKTVTNSFLVIRSSESSWSVTTNNGTYSPATGTDVPGIRANPVRGAVGLLDYMVVIDTNDFILDIPNASSAFVVQPSSVTQITSTTDSDASVTVSAISVVADNRAVTLTVASDNLVAEVSGEQSSVNIASGSLAASVTSISGNQLNIVVNEQLPQVQLQTALPGASASAEIVVTSKSVTDQVLVKEVFADGTSTTRKSDDGLQLNSFAAEVPKALVVEGVRDGLSAVSVRSLSNPEYKAEEPISVARLLSSTLSSTTSTPTTTTPTTTTTTTTVVPTTSTTIRPVPRTTTTTTSTTTTSTTTTSTPSTTTTLPYTPPTVAATTTSTTTTAPPPTTYGVTYNGNTNSSGSAPTDSGTYSNGDTVTVAGIAASFAKSGYAFGGWCTTQPAAGSDCGGTSRAAASTFAISTNTTLYAQWTALTARTIFINAASYLASYNQSASSPTLTSTASAGTGSKTYTSLTTSVCFALPTLGIIGLVTAGTCTIQMAIASDGTYAAATSPSISFSVTYAVGDTGPGGGKIFITPATVGNSTGKYFEAALNTWSSGSDGNNRWCNLTTTAVGTAAQGSAIGTGQSNTTAIVAACSSGAAVDARAYGGGSLSDWFLPSENELNQLWVQQTAVGLPVTKTQCCPSAGPSTNSYWSSTEIYSGRPGSSGYGIQAYPASSSIESDNWDKQYGFNVRPVRMFAPIS